MNDYKIDISVLLIFFTRHDQLRKVFAEVKIARPSRLFLYQDGPRKNNETDIENIKKCRDIVNDIDWECDVHRFYQEKNVGVDPSGYIADKWAFSMTDKCIVLEDDIVPTQSFFLFCNEMLNKYENDERIMLISGMNVEGITDDVKKDYFFSYTTITWGWASWSRVVNNWDPYYLFLNNKLEKAKVKTFIKKNHLVKNMLTVFKKHRDSGKAHFETILISNQYLNEGFTIVPTQNMIKNIGAVPDSAHFSSDLIFLSKGYKRIFTLPVYNIDTTCLQSQDEMVDNEKYRRVVYWTYGWNHPILRVSRFAQTCIKKIFKGKFKEVWKDIKNKF